MFFLKCYRVNDYKWVNNVIMWYNIVYHESKMCQYMLHDKGQSSPCRFIRKVYIKNSCCKEISWACDHKHGSEARFWGCSANFWSSNISFRLKWTDTDTDSLVQLDTYWRCALFLASHQLKRSILSSFSRQWFSDRPHVVVQGRWPRWLFM